MLIVATAIRGNGNPTCYLFKSCTVALIEFARRSFPAKVHQEKKRNQKKLDGA
jgi:hypothetical protein